MSELEDMLGGMGLIPDAPELKGSYRDILGYETKGSRRGGYRGFGRVGKKRVLSPVQQRIGSKGGKVGAAYRGVGGRYAKSPARMSLADAQRLFTQNYGRNQAAKNKAIAGAKRSRRVLYGKVGRVSNQDIMDLNRQSRYIPSGPGSLRAKRAMTWGKGAAYKELWPWQRRYLSPSALKNRKKLSPLASVQLYGQKRRIKSPAGCAAAIRVGQIVNRAKGHPSRKRSFAQSPRKQAALLKAAAARGNQKAYRTLVAKYPQGAALLGGLRRTL